MPEAWSPLDDLAGCAVAEGFCPDCAIVLAEVVPYHLEGAKERLGIRVLGHCFLCEHIFIYTDRPLVTTAEQYERDKGLTWGTP